MLQSSNTHLIVVLDEVDHLLRRSGDDIIYKLMRIDEDREGVGTLSTIMISQEQVLDLLENAVLSRVGRSNTSESLHMMKMDSRVLSNRE